MQTALYYLLSHITIKSIIIAVAILVIIGVFTLIKKVIRLGIAICILAVCIGLLGPAAKSFQSKFGFNVANGVATVTVAGQTVNLDKHNTSNIKMVNNSNGGYSAEITDTSGIKSINVSKPVGKLIESFANKNKIPVTETN